MPSRAFFVKNDRRTANDVVATKKVFTFETIDKLFIEKKVEKIKIPLECFTRGALSCLPTLG